jgi:hypothetical protein
MLISVLLTWMVSLPVPVLVVSIVALTILIILVLLLVACFPGASERLTKVLDGMYSLIYSIDSFHKRYQKHTNRSKSARRR